MKVLQTATWKFPPTCRRRGTDLLLLKAAVQQNGVIVYGVGVKRIDRSSLLVQRLCPDGVSTLLHSHDMSK